MTPCQTLPCGMTRPVRPHRKDPSDIQSRDYEYSVETGRGYRGLSWFISHLIHPMSSLSTSKPPRDTHHRAPLPLVSSLNDKESTGASQTPLVKVHARRLRGRARVTTVPVHFHPVIELTLFIHSFQPRSILVGNSIPKSSRAPEAPA